MKIAYITAGAAGMFCGSCMKDNTLVATLCAQGHDAILMPTYTPVTTDEISVAANKVFLGGINVYLQQKSRLFRLTPRWFDRLFDLPGLLRWVSRFAVKAKYEEQGDLAISMLEGQHGLQRKEIDNLAEWLATEFKPDAVVLTNVLLSGLVPAIRARLNVPVLATLQGDDIFLEALRPKDRERCISLIQLNANSINGLIATSDDYANRMTKYFGLQRDNVSVIFPGINLTGFPTTRIVKADPPYTLGYFARICPEKGFHHACAIYIALRRLPGAPMCRFKISGWLGENNRAFMNEHLDLIRQAGFGNDIDYVECPRHADKVKFMQSLDLLCVPTVYQEPKGMSILEAMASFVPCVQPAHGSFPELIAATGGGVLVTPGRIELFAATISDLLNDPSRRQQLADSGHRAVFAHFNAERMANQTLHAIQSVIAKRIPQLAGA